MTKAFNTADVKARLSELISRVVYGRERLIVLRRGKPVAALVSLQDLRRLEALDAGDTSAESQSTHPIMRAFGGWADRADIDELVAEIYANRDASPGREVAL